MARHLNPTNLPWFPFHSAAFLGSATVINMTVAERGIYITLLAMCWQNGSIIWNAKVLAKQTGIDYRVLSRFLESYGELTVKLQGSSREVTGKLQGSSRESTVKLLGTSGEVVFGKLSFFSQIMAKRGHAKTTHDMTQHDKTVDETTHKDTGSADAAHSAPVSALAENKPPSLPLRKGQLTYEPVMHSFPPVQGVSCSSPIERPPQSPPPPAPAPAPPELGDIREWNQDAFGVSAERLRNCLVYHLDHAKEPWFRNSGITVASMGREKFVTKLNANTPPGWTPASVTLTASKPAIVRTPEQQAQKDHNDKIQRLKKEGKLK